MAYEWEKRIDGMPKENGFLSDEALRELLYVAGNASTEAERNRAWQIYDAET